MTPTTERMTIYDLAACVDGVLMAAMFVPGAHGFQLTAELYRARKQERLLRLECARLTDALQRAQAVRP